MEETRFGDPYAKEITDSLAELQNMLSGLVPYNPVISKDDEWNDPSYDADYTKSLKTQ